MKKKHKSKKVVDKNVESIVKKMRARVQKGFSKYEVTTEREDLSLDDWLNHAEEEAMDFLVYLQAARKKIAKYWIPLHDGVDTTE